MKANYTGTAKSLHWLMALLIFGLLALGFYMQGLPFSPEKLKYYSWHKWAGVSVFLLAFIRVLWRVTHQPPALPKTMPRFMQIAAHAGHHSLYLLMFLIPLSGWLMSSAKGFQTVWFGVFPIPDLIPKNRGVGDVLQIVHVWLNYFLIMTLAGHIGAALKHHFFDRDDVLTRMLPKTKDSAE